MYRFTGYVMTIGLLALLVSCAKPPQQDIDAARAAVEAARSAEADLYAPAAFASASRALESLNAELDAQAARSPVSRKYASARTLAAEAREEAEKARNAAVIAKEQLEKQLAQEIPALAAAIAASEKAAAEAFAVRGIKLDREELDSELQSIKALATGAQAAVAAGTLIDARSKVSEANARVQARDQIIRAATEAAKQQPARRK